MKESTDKSYEKTESQKYVFKKKVTILSTYVKSESDGDS